MASPCERAILKSSITIEDIPDKLLEYLRRRVQADKRSVNREAIHLLGLALANQPVDQGVVDKNRDVEIQIQASEGSRDSGTPILTSQLRRNYRDSDNIVTRINLPNMRFDPQRKLETYAYSSRGLIELEPDLERRLKILDLIDIYAKLDDNERERG